MPDYQTLADMERPPQDTIHIVGWQSETAVRNDSTDLHCDHGLVVIINLDAAEPVADHHLIALRIPVLAKQTLRFFPHLGRILQFDVFGYVQNILTKHVGLDVSRPLRFADGKEVSFEILPADSDDHLSKTPIGDGTAIVELRRLRRLGIIDVFYFSPSDEAQGPTGPIESDAIKHSEDQLQQLDGTLQDIKAQSAQANR